MAWREGCNPPTDLSPPPVVFYGIFSGENGFFCLYFNLHSRKV